MPQIGMGTWKHYGAKATNAVYAGLQVGYRLIDCACGESSFPPPVFNSRSVGRHCVDRRERGMTFHSDACLTTPAH